MPFLSTHDLYYDGQNVLLSFLKIFFSEYQQQKPHPALLAFLGLTILSSHFAGLVYQWPKNGIFFYEIKDHPLFDDTVRIKK